MIAIRNILGAIERPDDELTVFAALRGPVFALTDAAILGEFRMTQGRLHPFRKLPDDLPDSLKDVKGALDVIKGLHRGRNRRPIAETIATLLAETRAHAGIAIWPTGEQALANIMRIMDQARRYRAAPAGGGPFVSGFRRRARSARRSRRGEPDADRRGRRGERCRNNDAVHGPQGLEFPAVIKRRYHLQRNPRRRVAIY